MIKEYFNGSDNTTIQLAYAPSKDSLLLFLDGVKQAESIDYTLAGSVVNLNFTFEIGSKINVRYAKTTV